MRDDNRGGLSETGKRKELALDLQRELEREFMLDQLQELSSDYADSPEQIGLYLADLEIAGLLTPADKGMVFRRLWETMGPAFADRAFGMTERAMVDGNMLAAEIASDAFVEVSGGRATFSDPAEYDRMLEASSALSALASVLGLKIDVPRPELKRRPAHIHDIDPERAEKTAEVLGSLGSQLGVDTDRVDVKVDDEARDKTAGQGIWGLMTDGTVFLDPELYDPETTAGRHLLAHELVHVAQLENRLRGANDAPDLYQAEAEADTLSAMFAQTGTISDAPLASLARYDQAACGPQTMATPGKEPPREGKTEVVREPPTYDIIKDCFDVPPIQFKVDKFEIAELMPGMLPVLQQVAASIKTYPQITGMHIEGHTSTTATAAHNLTLSKNRATKVTDWLKSDGAVTGVGFTHEGYGEEQARQEEGITDDKTSVEVTAQRKVVFRITHVEGQPAPEDWKPTRKVITMPGKTITRTYDADGKLVNEEIVVDSEGGEPAAATPTGGAETPPTSGGTTGPTSGGAAPAPAVSGSGPAAQSSGGPAAPAQTGPTAGQPAPKPKKAKARGKTDKIKMPRRYAQSSIIADSLLQAKAGPGGLTATTIDQSTRSSGAGESLSDGVRGRFESAFGANFNDVRIHRGSAQATGIGAAAFARGTDIHFAPGRFDTDTSSGLAILGHELTHIVQQRAGRVAISQGKGTHVNAERALEAEADLLGARAARGETVHVQGSSAGLYARAARGDADTIQYTDEGGAAGEAGARPEHAEIRLGGQRIRASMPAGGQSPGRLTIDFSGAASVPGLRLSQASLVFNDQWEITEGHITAAIAIGSFVNCEDVRLVVQQREDSTGKYAELACEVNDADFKIEGLLDSKINLRLSTSGVSGTAHVNFADLNIGQNVSLTGGTMDFTLTEAGEATVSGSVNGTVTVGEVTANVELRGEAMSNGNMSAAATISLASPVAVPGVEGVTIKSGSITGSYVHNQEWTLNGNLLINVRDWVEADITASYKQPAEGAAEWELNGTLRQLQPYTLGEGTDTLTFENGEIDLHFRNGEFVNVAARTDFSSTNWAGRLTGDFNVADSKLTAVGAIHLVPPELAIGTTGIKLTRADAVMTLTDNVLEQVTGGGTAIFPYDGQDTFRLDGQDITYRVQEQKITGTTTVTTLRDLSFGNTAAYNAKVSAGAVGTLSVADNNLLGVSGGLAFSVNHGAGKIGDGTVDINFDGPTQALNAVANFTLTAEGGFGVPNRETGPVMLKPGGEFQLTITNSALGAATVRNIGFEVKQSGEGATGKIAGLVNGSYNFLTEKLTVTGNATLEGDWPLQPADGVTLTFHEGGSIDVAVTENALTRVHGAFPYSCVIAAKERVPEIQVTGEVRGDYSDESKKFSGALTGQLENAVVIPVRGDTITVKPGASLIATVTDSVPDKLSMTFDVDYARQGALFCAGHVETAKYNFRTGDFDFDANLTLKQKIEKQTSDGKWKFVVNEESTVGVKVEKSELKLITGSIPFEIHDATAALFKGNLTNAELNVPDLEFTGTLDLALARDMSYPRTAEGAEAAPAGTPPVQAVAKKDVSHITGQITKNALTTVGATLMFGVNLGGVEYGAGELTGNINMTNSQFGGTGKINLIKDLVMGGNEENASGDPIASWHLVFPAGQGLDIAIVANHLDEANLNLNAKLLHNNEEVANGGVTGRYKLGDTEGFSGSINANVIKDVDLTQDDRFHYWLETGSSFRAAMSKNSIDSATGSFALRMNEIAEGNRPAVHVAVSGGYTKGPGFSAEAQITVLNDIKVGEGGEFKFFIGQGSGGGAHVEGTKVTEFHGGLTLKVNKGENPFAQGVFNLTYNNGGAATVLNCDGNVALMARTDVTPEGLADWQFFLDPATGVGFKVTNNDLEYVKGQVNFAIKYKNVESISGNVHAEYYHQTKDVSANGQMNVVHDMRVADDLPGGYKLVIEQGTSAAFDVKQAKLQTVTGTVKVRIEDEAPLCRVEMGGTYTHTPAPKFDGGGAITLIRNLEVGSSADGKYKFNVLQGTGATATIANSKLTQITGSLLANVEDGTGEFGRLEGTVTANKVAEAWKITATGVSLGITRDKEMLTTATGFVVFLKVGSGATISVADNELASLGGTIKVETQKNGTAFAKVDVGGTYTPTGGFNGGGTAELCQPYEVAATTMGGEAYTVWVMPGTGAKIDLAASDIKHVGGQVIGMIKDATGDFIRVEVQADYDFPGKNFSGSGSITVLKPKLLKEAEGNQLWLAEGSGASGSVAKNNLQKITGALNLQLKDATAGHWLTCALQGGFDAQGGTGFSGSGTITVHKDKKLADLGDYKFFLAEGGGASAKIAQNSLTEVTGNVPFKIFDTEAEPLITGHAEGKYNATTQKFTGSGAVFLGRDVEYPIGGGKLVFKKGSGGGGEVANNELRKLTGTLKVDIYDGEEGIVGLEADGVFNAVTNTVERLSGTARLLRDIEVGGEGENAFLRITQLTGTALVVNNELKELGGSLDFVLPRLNNMKGHFEGGWQKTAGADIFWGSGKIQFTLFDDPATGRKLSGEVDGNYEKSGNFQVHGEVDYKLNDMIGGKLTVAVDQNLDPVLGGTLEVTNVQLVQGRDLFKWGKDFTLLRTTVAAGPVPIAMAGGVNIGLGLSMLPLTFNASIGVTNFKPLSQNVKVPDFTAHAELNTGLRMAASLKPWFSIGVGVAGVASAGLALQGEASLNVDVNVTPFADLRGVGGVYSGDLGVGLNIVGSGALALTPQVYAELLGQRWPYDLTEIRHELGPLFSFDYNYSFPFGDAPAAPQAGGGGAAQTTSAAAETQRIEGHETPPPPAPGTGGTANRPGPTAGGPDMNAANPDSEQGAQREGPMAELMQKIDRIQEWGAKIGAVAKVGGTLVSMLMFMVTIPPPFGVALAGAYLAYKIISGGLTFGDIVTAATTVWELIQQIDLSGITALLPEWLVNLWTSIKGKSLDDLLIDMIDRMASWLSETFPSAAPVIDALAGVARTVIQTIARIISAIMSGSFGIGTFLDICRTVGGAVLGAVVQMAAEAAAEAVADAAGAVVDFVASLW